MDTWKYVDIDSIWDKIKPLLETGEGFNILQTDFEKYVNLLHKFYPDKWQWIHGKKPIYWDYVYWRPDDSPEWYDYTCHGACHWLANTNLYLAKTIYPNVPWSIVTSPSHTTVWNREHFIFDMNYLALGQRIESAIYNSIMHDECKLLPAHTYMELLNQLFLIQKYYIIEHRKYRCILIY